MGASHLPNLENASARARSLLGSVELNSVVTLAHYDRGAK